MWAGLLGLGVVLVDRMHCRSGSVWWLATFRSRNWWYRFATVLGCTGSLVRCCSV